MQLYVSSKYAGAMFRKLHICSKCRVQLPSSEFKLCFSSPTASSPEGSGKAPCSAKFSNERKESGNAIRLIATQSSIQLASSLVTELENNHSTRQLRVLKLVPNSKNAYLYTGYGLWCKQQAKASGKI